MLPFWSLPSGYRSVRWFSSTTPFYLTWHILYIDLQFPSGHQATRFILNIEVIHVLGIFTEFVYQGLTFSTEERFTASFYVSLRHPRRCKNCKKKRNIDVILYLISLTGFLVGIHFTCRQKSQNLKRELFSRHWRARSTTVGVHLKLLQKVTPIYMYMRIVVSYFTKRWAPGERERYSTNVICKFRFSFT